MSTPTNDLKPSLFTPPHAGQIQTAEMEERKLCSLMLKSADTVAEVLKVLTTEMFWNQPCAEMFHVCEIYYREHKKLVGPDTFRSMMEKIAKPESVVGAMQFYAGIFALPVTTNELPWVKGQILGRHAKRQACGVLDKYYQRLMTGTIDPLGDAKAFIEETKSIRLPTSNAPAIRKFSELSMGDDNGGCLIGDRYLCRQGDLLINAATGVGKSVMIEQAAFCWALGRDFLGLRPVAPLKSLIVQSENDEGDLVMFRDRVASFLSLTADDLATLDDRIRVVSQSTLSGPDFIAWLDGVLGDWTPDIVFIDPLFAFLGEDVCDQGEVSRFIRNGLKPLLQKYNIGEVMVHHTNKPQRGSKITGGSDSAYAGSGSMELANAYRAVISIFSEPGKYGEYKMSFGKRGGFSGIRGTDGKTIREFKLRWASEGGHSMGFIADHEQTGTGHGGKRTHEDIVLGLVPSHDWVGKDTLQGWAMDEGVSLHNFRRIIGALLEQDRIFTWKIPRPGRKSGTGFSQVPQSDKNPVGNMVTQTGSNELLLPVNIDPSDNPVGNTVGFSVRPDCQRENPVTHSLPLGSDQIPPTDRIPIVKNEKNTNVVREVSEVAYETLNDFATRWWSVNSSRFATERF